MSHVYSPHEFYLALRTILTNLPEFCIAIDVHLDAKSLPSVKVESHCRREDGTPRVENDTLITETRTFKIMPADDFAPLEERMARQADQIRDARQLLRRAREFAAALRDAVPDNFKASADGLEAIAAANDYIERVDRELARKG